MLMNRKCCFRGAALAVCLVLTLLLTGCVSTPASPETTATPENSAAPETTTAPESSTAPDTSAAPEATPAPAAGYVRVTAGNEARWFALPEEEPYNITIKQKGADDAEHVNVIHFTPESVSMESSTCDNQDCVEQGEATLQNKDVRVLANWIICLPNQVSIELFTPEEVRQLGQEQQ